MAKLQYKKENQWFSITPYDIDPNIIWKNNDNNNTGIVSAGRSYPNSIWQNNNNQIGWKQFKDFAYSSFSVPDIGNFYRYGQFVVWDIPGIKRNNTTNTTLIYSSLPKEYRPANNIVIPIAGHVDQNFRCNVTKNGNITFYCSEGSWNMYIWSTSWWLTDEGAEVITV